MGNWYNEISTQFWLHSQDNLFDVLEATPADSRIEAEDFSLEGGTQTVQCSEGGFSLSSIEGGDFSIYKNLDFGSGLTEFQIRVSSNTIGGDIQIRLDSPTGTLIGTCSVTNTGGWNTYVTETVNITETSGVHDVYLLYTGSSGYLFNVNWFRFSNPEDTKIEAEYGTTYGNGRVCTDTGASNGESVGYLMYEGDALELYNVSSATRLTIAYAIYWDAKMSLYVNGAHVKDISLPATGGFASPYFSTVTVDVNIPDGATVKLQVDNGDVGAVIDYISTTNDT